MRCIDCENIKIVAIEDGCGASAKCFKTSKKGKSITWAMATLSNNGDKEKGEDRVIKYLETKKTAPFWCPNKKRSEDDE